jgi:hypothetical protein
MEPTFWGVIWIVIPILALVFFFIRKGDKDPKGSGHNLYRNYRKTRMDEHVD